MVNASHRFNNDLRYRGDTHPNQTQLTPPYALEPIRVALGGSIELDPCTEPDNPTGAARFYSLPTDGATEPWVGDSIFCNPPYSKARERWALRCIAAGEAGARVALLIPAHPDTRIFQTVMASAHSVTFVRGRLKFGIPRDNGRQQAASHGSAILTWNCFTEPLEVLGVTIQLRNEQVGA
jgi:hypothetical protein